MSIIDNLILPSGIRDLTFDQLDLLAGDVREIIINTISENGGHLAPSLGVVELTIAILKVFDPLNDRIVWDVGHQSYAFKILTDRLKSFSSIRKYKGISGFNKLSESIYDAFGVGHTSTSISAALGIRSSLDYFHKKDRTIAVIGDGAMTAGLAFEGLNNLGHMKKKVIVILNDNEMSISPNVGAISNYLSKLMTGEVYTKFRKDVQGLLEHAPLGGTFLQIAKKMEEGVKGLFTPGILFEELGLKYIGPVDGHNTREVVKALHNAEIQDSPVLIHVSTKKGKGYAPAEKNPSKFHGVSKFDIATGESYKFNSVKTFTEVFGESLVEIGENDNRVVAVTAAMPDGTGVTEFSKLFPDRFYDVGIAEQHAVTFAAGMAAAGSKPYVAIYSTFFQRAYDQIIHDVCLQKLPVTLCVDRGGLVGEDGPTHHGIFDISFLRCIPNLTIMLPKNGQELKQMINLSLNINAPVAVRYPRGGISFDDIMVSDVELGKMEIIEQVGDIAVISVGHIFCEVKKAFDNLSSSGIKCGLANLRFLKPFDIEALTKFVSGKKFVVVVEENSIKGGAGEEIQSVLSDCDIMMKVIKIGIPDNFVEHGDISSLRKQIQLDSDSIYNVIKAAWEKRG